MKYQPEIALGYKDVFLVPNRCTVLSRKEVNTGYTVNLPLSKDPSKVINALTKAIKDRQDGVQIEDALSDAFAPQVPPQQVAAPGEAQAPGQMAPAGVPTQAAPQQAGGGSALQSLLAGLSSSGQANLSANVARRQPA